MDIMVVLSSTKKFTIKNDIKDVIVRRNPILIEYS